MKLISQTGRPAPPRPVVRSRPSILRWIRARSRLERELLIKAVFALATAAIAIYAVHLLAHVTQVMEQSVNR